MDQSKRQQACNKYYQKNKEIIAQKARDKRQKIRQNRLLQSSARNITHPSVQGEAFECPICYEEQDKIIPNVALCGDKRHDICLQCYHKVRNSTCPICKQNSDKYPQIQTIHFVLEYAMAVLKQNLWKTNGRERAALQKQLNILSNHINNEIYCLVLQQFKQFLSTLRQTLQKFEQN